ncbi:MAG: Dabb family protein [Verrucomicrobiales bacterium]|nr:Dabb family protein [Verrucomicrobiales bacterium]
MKFFHTIAFAFSLLLLSATVQADDHEAPLFRHAVYFQFKETATDKEIQRIVDEFLLLEEKIETIVDIEWGVSESVEGLNDDFTHCFLVSFKDKAGLEVYIPHPDHKAFVEILKPSLEKVFVFDYTQKD